MVQCVWLSQYSRWSYVLTIHNDLVELWLLRCEGNNVSGWLSRVATWFNDFQRSAQRFTIYLVVFFHTNSHRIGLVTRLNSRNVSEFSLNSGGFSVLQPINRRLDLLAVQVNLLAFCFKRFFVEFQSVSLEFRVNCYETGVSGSFIRVSSSFIQISVGFSRISASFPRTPLTFSQCQMHYCSFHNNSWKSYEIARFHRFSTKITQFSLPRRKYPPKRITVDGLSQSNFTLAAINHELIPQMESKSMRLYVNSNPSHVIHAMWAALGKQRYARG